MHICISFKLLFSHLYSNYSWTYWFCVFSSFIPSFLLVFYFAYYYPNLDKWVSSLTNYFFSPSNPNFVTVFPLPNNSIHTKIQWKNIIIKSYMNNFFFFFFIFFSSYFGEWRQTSKDWETLSHLQPAWVVCIII